MSEEKLATAPPKDVLLELHNRIRVRLWMQRLGAIATNIADERYFETRMRSFTDDALRRRLEDEMQAAKQRMEEEVRDAKATMLQCVQVVSEEVDRRVRDKVAALQEELDQRTAAQSRDLRDLVERRVYEQTAALQAEVDRRTNCVRETMEQRAHDQEAAATQLRAEVMQTRTAFEQRLMEQEATAGRLAEELRELCVHLMELTSIRESLEAKVSEQQLTIAELRNDLLCATVHPNAREGNETCFSCYSGSLRALSRMWRPRQTC